MRFLLLLALAACGTDRPKCFVLSECNITVTIDGGITAKPVDAR